jgi:DNA-binding NarL/FixJ family response regulator
MEENTIPPLLQVDWINPEKPLRIMIVDDEAINRLALRSFLDSYEGLTTVAEASNGVEAIRTADTRDLDVIIMDIKMPEMDGIAATRLIKAKLPEIKILIHSSFYKRADVDEAMEAGANGFISKDSKPENLVGALKMLHHGEIFLE